MPEPGETLSDRELAVLQLLAGGSSNREIAQDLDISHNTVKVHLRNIFAKLGVSSRIEATTVALQRGLVTMPGVDAQNGVAAEAPAETQAELTPPQPGVDGRPARAVGLWRLAAAVLGLIILVFAVLWVVDALPGLGAGSPDPGGSLSTEQRIEDNSNWFRAPVMPTQRAGMALASVGLNLYQIGGEVEAGTVNLVDVYRTDTHEWRSAASKPTAVADAAAAVLFGEIYVVGGRLVNGQATSIVEVYSPVNNAWRPVAALPRPVAGGLALAAGELLYIFGGWDGTTNLADALVYDPAADAWGSLPPMARARADAVGGLLGGRLYVIGGAAGGEELADCAFFDLSSGAWGECPPMTHPRAGAGAAVIGSTHIYVFGGGRSQNVLEGESYDAENDTWQPVPIPMLLGGEPWYDLGVTNVETRIYLVGGRQGEAILGETYVYLPFIHRTFLPTIGDEN